MRDSSSSSPGVATFRHHSGPACAKVAIEIAEDLIHADRAVEIGVVRLYVYDEEVFFEAFPRRLGVARGTVINGEAAAAVVVVAAARWRC